MIKRIGFLALMITSCLNACPTCVGKITHSGPAFFTDNFYTPELKKQLSASVTQEVENDDDDDNSDDSE